MNRVSDISEHSFESTFKATVQISFIFLIIHAVHCSEYYAVLFNILEDLLCTQLISHYAGIKDCAN